MIYHETPIIPQHYYNQKHRYSEIQTSYMNIYTRQHTLTSKEEHIRYQIYQTTHTRDSNQCLETGNINLYTRNVDCNNTSFSQIATRLLYNQSSNTNQLFNLRSITNAHKKSNHRAVSSSFPRYMSRKVTPKLSKSHHKHKTSYN